MIWEVLPCDIALKLQKRYSDIVLLLEEEPSAAGVEGDDAAVQTLLASRAPGTGMTWTGFPAEEWDVVKQSVYWEGGRPAWCVRTDSKGMEADEYLHVFSPDEQVSHMKQLDRLTTLEPQLVSARQAHPCLADRIPVHLQLDPSPQTSDESKHANKDIQTDVSGVVSFPSSADKVWSRSVQWVLWRSNCPVARVVYDGTDRMLNGSSRSQLQWIEAGTEMRTYYFDQRLTLIRTKIRLLEMWMRICPALQQLQTACPNSHLKAILERTDLLSVGKTPGRDRLKVECAMVDETRRFLSDETSPTCIANVSSRVPEWFPDPYHAPEKTA